MKHQESHVIGRFALRGAFVFLALFLLAFASAHAVDLFVSGIATPAAANGRYVPNGTFSGYDSWVHEAGGYYIYNDFYSTITPALRYWNIDNDLNDEGSASVLFFSSNNSDGASPALVTSWSPDQGTGTPVVTAGSANPEIDIQGNSVTIADGSAAVTLINHTHFGSVDLSAGSVTRTFTIRNLGAAALTISGASPYVTVSGAQAANFVVSAAPAASIPAAGSTTFQVTFTPTAAGNHNATLSIGSNDADESPYTFAILGRGFTPRDLVVSGITAPAAANGNYVHQGVIFNMEYWKHETLGYYLFNDEYSSSRYWNIDVDTDDSDTDYLFYIVSDAGTPVGLTGWSRGTGITGDPLINEANPAPDIMVRGNGVVIVDDDASPSFADHTQFGSLAVSSGSRSRTFTIENTGNAVLTLTGPSPYVAVSGVAAGDFSVTTPPAATIAAYGSTTFTGHLRSHGRRHPKRHPVDRQRRRRRIPLQFFHPGERHRPQGPDRLEYHRAGRGKRRLRLPGHPERVPVLDARIGRLLYLQRRIYRQPLLEHRHRYERHRLEFLFERPRRGRLARQCLELARRDREQRLANDRLQRA